MKKSQFDKNLKDNLQQYISKVDTNALWANIESEVDDLNKNKQKKNRFFIWLLSFGIILLGGVFYLTKTFLSPTPTVIKSEVLSTQITTTPNIILEKEKNSSIVENVKFSTIIETEASTVSKKDIFDNQKNKNIFSNNKSITNQPVEYFPVSKNNKTDNNSIQKSPIIDSQKEKTSFSKNIITLPILASSQSFIKNEPVLPFELLDEDWSFAAADLKRTPYYSSKKPLQFSFEIQGGVSNTNRNFQKNQPETIDYINLRKETEKALETIHFGVLLNLAHHSGLELSTGISATNITEKFEFQGSTIEMDTIEEGLFGYIINPNGDTIPVFDEIINSNEIFYNKRTYNKYRMIGVPILFSYHWKDDAWSFGIESGIIANISLKTSGNILNNEGQIIDIQEEQEKVFRSKIGLSYSFGLSGRYYITDHLQVTANPFLRYFPKSFTLSNYPVNQNYYIVGGNVGLRYTF